MMTSRKEFLTKSLLFATGIVLTPKFVLSQTQEKPQPIDPKIVKDFVSAAHSDLGKVKVLLKQYPLLLNSAHDWGGGDFETAIGGAGHLGLVETANFLLSQGARADIFVLTMLGKIAIVKSMLADYPNLLHSKGPHGFTLLHHAKKGGSNELVDYFQSLGLTETFIKLY
ncbi:MAG: hypothetical protein ACKVOQ_04515 [Cyclobacteriaceae bacterium]